MTKRIRMQFSSTMKSEYHKKLKDISEETGIPISKLLDKAIKLLLIEMDEYSFSDKILDKSNNKNDSQ